MAESPDGDRLTDGEGLFGNGQSPETAPVTTVIPETNNNPHNDHVQKGVENVLYSDV